MNSHSQVFLPLPTYIQTITKNDFWVNVTITRTDPDGSKSQVLTIAPIVKSITNGHQL